MDAPEAAAEGSVSGALGSPGTLGNVQDLVEKAAEGRNHCRLFSIGGDSGGKSLGQKWSQDEP